MKSLKTYITTRLFVFLAIYSGIFAFSLRSMVITMDEYDGGNTLAEAGTQLFDFFGFPLFTFFDCFSGDTHNELFLLLAFSFNLLLNCLICIVTIEILVHYIGKAIAKR